MCKIARQRRWLHSRTPPGRPACPTRLIGVCSPPSVNVNGKPTRTIWASADGAVEIIDQTALPHAFVVRPLRTVAEVAHAIASMQVRGAPLIGAAAAYGIWLAMRADASDGALAAARAALAATRPTAVNLRWALDAMAARLAPLAPDARPAAARAAADALADDDVAINRAIGAHAHALIRAAGARRARGEPVQVLTHCNAGWLATVDWGRRWRRCLRGARRGPAGARLGRRDAAAQPGRGAHRLGAGRARRPAHGDRRQRGRPPHAARPGRHRARRHRPHDGGRRRRQQDRHVPEGAGRAATAACRSTSRRRRLRSTGRSRDGADGIPIEERAADEVTTIVRRGGLGRGDARAPRARGEPRAQPGLRRHARAPGHRHRHRARRRGGVDATAWRACSRSAPRDDGRALRGARSSTTVRWLMARRLNAGTSGNVSVRSGGGLPHHADGRDLRRRRRGDDRGADAWTAVARGALRPVQRVAHPPRHLSPPARGRRRRAHPLDVRDRARLPAPAHPRRSTTWSPRRAATTSAARATRRSARAALSRNALAALAGRRACLLANHGLLALGADVASARLLAEEVEALCEQYILARVAGAPVILPAREMKRVRAKFATYGRRT